MHIVIAALGILAGIYFFVIRARNAAEMTNELLDVADDIRAAARRFGFKRRHDRHPMESVDDPNVAAATIAVAYLELHGMPSAGDRSNLSNSLQVVLDISAKDAEEIMVLGRWLMNECGTPSAAITRAAKKLYKLSGGDVEPMMEILRPITSDPISTHQSEALHDIRIVFNIRGNG